MAAIYRPRGAIVLVESGANAPSGVDRSMTELRTESVHAITQLDSEEPGAFMLRAMSELASIESAGAPMTLGVVACNDRIDPEQLASREIMTHALASAMARSDGERIILYRSSRSGSDVQHEVLRLSEQLVEAHPGLAAGVCVDAQRQPARSASSKLEAVA